MNVNALMGGILGKFMLEGEVAEGSLADQDLLAADPPAVAERPGLGREGRDPAGTPAPW